MRKNYFHLNKKGFTLLELLIILMITGIMMVIVVGGVMRFRQVIIVSNTAKEIKLKLQEARRNAINSVVTSDGNPTSGYFIKLGSNDYIWGECSQNDGCDEKDSVKSKEYSGVEVSGCKVGGTNYNYVKFANVTGDFIINNNQNSFENSVSTICTIEVKITEAGMTTTREIEVSASGRTIRIK